VFRPARTGIQRLVDRRFFRHKYDALRTLESFGSWVRNEVEVQVISTELRDVVAQTMRPAHMTLWLRDPHNP